MGIRPRKMAHLGRNIQLGLFCIIFLALYTGTTEASYEDNRCRCICPDPAVVNGTKSNRKIYIQPVAPSRCDCDSVVLPQVIDDIKGRETEFCTRCECKYESRNITTIKVVVILVIWIISLLV